MRPLKVAAVCALTLAASCPPSVVHAATVTVSWVAPTLCSDGTSISNCPITKYTVYQGQQGNVLTAVGGTAPNITTFVATNVSGGQWCYAVSASSQAGESALSMSACVTVTMPVPQPPAAPTLSVTVSKTTAYDQLKSKDTLSLLPVGNVPAGTVCDPTQGMTKAGIWYFVVPVSKVTFTGSARPLAVVAQCS